MEELDFKEAGHTLIVSDIHLSEGEIAHPKRYFWKRYKRPEHFIDASFKAFLDCLSKEADGPIELVLNGDIFDFDAVMKIPEQADFHVSWLEKIRGLSSEEPKSQFKMKVILDAHPLWINAVREFILAGNRVVFVIGNHDLELHWGSVRQTLLEAFNLPPDTKQNVRFCEWFYISNQDTLIEHGNQYDAYCLCANPIHPLVRSRGKNIVRLPFGNLAGKYMINGIGLMNPHAPDSYIKSSAWEYFVFYYRYMMRTQPFLLWTWFWSAMVTLIYSITEGFLPPVRDPLTVDMRISDIAQRANASMNIVLSLKEVHVHPAIFNPFKILRELWLDRAILLGSIVVVSFQFFSVLNVFAHVSLGWFIGPLIVLFPAFVFYARSVQSEVDAAQMAAFHMAPLSAQIAHVKRVVQGHTHLENHRLIGDVEIINTGTWSPAFKDIECTLPYGKKCFAWIKPGRQGSQREAELYEWKESGFYQLIQRT